MDPIVEKLIEQLKAVSDEKLRMETELKNVKKKVAELNSTIQENKIKVIKVEQKLVEKNKIIKIIEENEKIARQKEKESNEKLETAKSMLEPRYQQVLEEIFENPTKDIIHNISEESQKTNDYTLKIGIISLIISVVLSVGILFYSSYQSNLQQKKIYREFEKMRYDIISLIVNEDRINKNQVANLGNILNGIITEELKSEILNETSDSTLLVQLYIDDISVKLPENTSYENLLLAFKQFSIDREKKFFSSLDFKLLDHLKRQLFILNSNLSENEFSKIDTENQTDSLYLRIYETQARLEYNKYDLPNYSIPKITRN